MNICRTATLVDLAHDIPPQDIGHASWVLDQAFDYFPAGTFFVVVVDPGVGSKTQKRLALYSPSLEKGLILPDNGLATRLFNRCPDWECSTLSNPKFFCTPGTISQTFHGRDVYAAVAAHLALAWQEGYCVSLLSSLGNPVSVEHLTRLPINVPVQKATRLEGIVDIVDIYGNIITNIPNAWLESIVAGTNYTLQTEGRQFQVVYRQNYQDADNLAIIPGSHGRLEIVCFQANAQHATQLSRGDNVFLVS